MESKTRDIVEKLRFGCPFKPNTIGEKNAEAAEIVMDAAADEVERLVAEMERLKSKVKELQRSNGILLRERVVLHGDNATIQASHDRYKAALERINRSAPYEEETVHDYAARVSEMAQESLADAVRP